MKIFLTIMLLCAVFTSFVQENSIYINANSGGGKLFTNYKPTNAEFKNGLQLCAEGNIGFQRKWNKKSSFRVGIGVTYLSSIEETKREFESDQGHKRSSTVVSKRFYYTGLNFSYGRHYQKWEFSIGGYGSIMLKNRFIVNGFSETSSQLIDWEYELSDPIIRVWDAGIISKVYYHFNKNLSANLGYKQGLINIADMKSTYPDYSFPYKNYTVLLTLGVEWKFINFSKD